MPQLYKQKLLTNHSGNHEHSQSAIPVDILNILFILWLQQETTLAKAQGLQQGIQQTEKALQPLKNTLQNLLENIPDTLQKSRLQLQKDIADIVLTILEQLFLQETPPRHLLEKQINTLLMELNHQQNLTIHLHPDDLLHLQQGDIHLQTSPLQKIAILPDKSLLPGGCLIKTEHGLFDLSLEKRFQRLQIILSQIREEHSHASLA